MRGLPIGGGRRRRTISEGDVYYGQFGFSLEAFGEVRVGTDLNPLLARDRVAAALTRGQDVAAAFGDGLELVVNVAVAVQASLEVGARLDLRRPRGRRAIGAPTPRHRLAVEDLAALSVAASHRLDDARVEGSRPLNLSTDDFSLAPDEEEEVSAEMPALERGTYSLQVSAEYGDKRVDGPPISFVVDEGPSFWTRLLTWLSSHVLLVIGVLLLLMVAVAGGAVYYVCRYSA